MDYIESYFNTLLSLETLFWQMKYKVFFYPLLEHIYVFLLLRLQHYVLCYVFHLLPLGALRGINRRYHIFLYQQEWQLLWNPSSRSKIVNIDKCKSSCKYYKISNSLKFNLLKNHNLKIHDDNPIIPCKNVCKDVQNQHV